MSTGSVMPLLYGLSGANPESEVCLRFSVKRSQRSGSLLGQALAPPCGAGAESEAPEGLTLGLRRYRAAQRRVGIRLGQRLFQEAKPVRLGGRLGRSRGGLHICAFDALP